MALRPPLKLVSQAQPFATRIAQDATRDLREHADAINGLSLGAIPSTRRALIRLVVTTGATLEAAPFPIRLTRPQGFARVSGLLLMGAINETMGAISYGLGQPHWEVSAGDVLINYVPGLEVACTWTLTFEAVGS